MNNLLEILGKEYIVLETITVSIADSFVKTNKLAHTNGNGEARLYIGSNIDENKNFFNNFINIKGILFKHHFKRYLEEASFEYKEQEQVYREDISSLFHKYHIKISEMKDIEYFDLYSVNDTSRFYIRSNNDIYTFLREILIPIISKLSIVKVEKDNNFLYIFRPFIEYSKDSREEIDKLVEIEKNSNNIEIETDRLSLTLSRKGQGKYRKDLLDSIPFCLITEVDDDRLLIASHIKPWSKSSNYERIDKYNGLTLTPTYDKLFDKGFITFTNKGDILISAYLSTKNIERLNIPKKIKIGIPSIDKRKCYLEYHRNHVFLKD